MTVIVRRHPILASCFALILAVGCGNRQSEDAPRRAQTEQATNPPSSAPQANSEQPRNAEQRPATEVSPEIRAQGVAQAAALREARRLSRSRDYPGAWRVIAPLASSAAGNGHIQCEAGFIAFRAGLLEEAETKLRSGLGLLAQDATRQGRNGRGMCFYNLALVQEAQSHLGDAVCSLRASVRHRQNRTASQRLEQMTATLASSGTLASCDAPRARPLSATTANSQAVLRHVQEYMGEEWQTTGIESTTAAGFTIHEVALAQRVNPDEESVEAYGDVTFVVLDRGGVLFDLGVTDYEDESITYFRSNRTGTFVESRPSPDGPLLFFRISGWGRGDPEHVPGEISASESTSLVVCRPEAEDATEPFYCVLIPISASENCTDGCPSDDALARGEEGIDVHDVDHSRDEQWQIGVSYTYNEASGTFVFVREHGDAATVEEVGYPIGRMSVDEVFESFSGSFDPFML